MPVKRRSAAGRASRRPFPPEASAFEERVLDQFRSHGLRVTMPRVQVVRTLATAQRPLTAYGIHDAIIEDGGRIDVVSVYRILATLSQLGMIHHIGIVDGYLACRLGDHHHDDETEHAVCQECGRVVELAVPEEARRATQAQLASIGFRALSIKVEILGFCTACAAVA